ncbi:hypothetical protein MP638_003829 [Amoeboaphelidium occidentale]|nr:hypothetical protein MP638_003829 [Amoeboaphelidium occidentale]
MSNSSESLLNLERRLCSPFQLPRDLAEKELKLKNSASDMCLLLQSGKISSKVKCGLLRILLDIELNANDAKELLRKMLHEPSLTDTYLVKSVLYLCTKLKKMEGLNYSSATTSVYTLLPLLTIYEKNDGRLSIDDIVVGSVDALLEGYADFGVVSALVKYFWVDSKGQEFLVKFIDYFEYSADETENYAQLSSSMRELIVSLEKSVALHLNGMSRHRYFWVDSKGQEFLVKFIDYFEYSADETDNYAQLSSSMRELIVSLEKSVALHLNGMSRHRVLQFLFEDLPKGSILILLENSMNDDFSIPVILSHVPFLLAEKLLTEVELLLLYMLFGYMILDWKVQSEEAIGDMLQIMILIYSLLESGEFATVCKCARISLLHVLYKKKLLEISSTDDEFDVYKSAEKLARDISSLGFIKSGAEVADKVEKYLNETNLNGSIYHAFVSAFASEGMCIDSIVGLLVLPCFDSQDLKSVIKSCDKEHLVHLMCYLLFLLEKGEEPVCQRILLEDFPQLIKESNNDSFLMSRIMTFCSEFDIYPELLYKIIHCNSRVIFGQLFKKLKQTILKISDNSIEPSRELLSACGILLKISEEERDFLYTKEIIFLAKELITKATNTNRSAESVYEFVFYVGARVTLNFCNNSLISFEEAQAILKPCYSKWQFKIALNVKEEIRYYGLIGKFVHISQHEETNLKRIEAVKTLCSKDFLNYEEDIFVHVSQHEETNLKRIEAVKTLCSKDFLNYEEDIVESLCMFETYELINFFSECLKPKEEDQVEAPEITTESIILCLKTQFSKSYHKLLSKFIDEEISQIGRAAFKGHTQTLDINRKRHNNPFANFPPSFKGVISFDSLVNGGGQNLEVELDTALLDLENVRDLAFLTESSQYDLILQHDMVNIEGFKRFFLNNLNESNYIVFLHKLLVLEVNRFFLNNLNESNYIVFLHKLLVLEVNVNYSYALAGFVLALSDMKMFSMVESQVFEYYHVSVTQKLSQLNSFQVFALILSITTVFPHCSSSNTVTNSIRDAIHKLYKESSDSIARYITSYFIGANCSYMNVDHLVSELKKAFMLNLTNKRTVVEDTLVIDAETILGFGGGLAHAALTCSDDNVVSILRDFNVEIFIMDSTPANILVSNQRLSLLKVGMLFCQILHENGFSPALTAKFSEISEMEQLDFYSSFYDYKFGKGTVFKTPGASLALLSTLRYVLIRDLDGLEKDLKKMVKMQSGNKYAYLLYSLLVSNSSNAASGSVPALTAKFSEISEMEQLDFYSSFYDYKFGKGTVFKTPGASLALLSALRYGLLRDLDGLERDLKKMVKMQSGNKYAYLLYSLLVSNSSNAASGSVFNEPPNYDRFQSSSYIKTVFDLITKGHQLDLLQSFIIHKPLPLVNWTFILQNVTDQSLLESFCSAHVYHSVSVQIYVFNNFTKFNYETLITAASCLLKENNHMVSSLALKAALSHIIQTKNGEEVNHILRLLHSSILANVTNLDNNLIEVFADMAKNIVEQNLSNLSEVDDVSLDTIHFVAKTICVVDVHQEMKKNQVGMLLQLNIMLQLKEYNQAIDLLRKADLAGRASFFKYIELSRLDAKEIYTVVMRVVDYILLYNATDLFDVLGVLMIKSSKPEVDTVQLKISEDLYPRILQDYMEFMKSKSFNSEDFKIKIATLVSTQMKHLVYKFDSILQCDALKQAEINLLASIH